jgi:hypothetical protein
MSNKLIRLLAIVFLGSMVLTTVGNNFLGNEIMEANAASTLAQTPLQVALYYSSSNLQAAAVQYSYSTGNGLTSAQIRTIKAANPNHKIFAYRNFEAVYTNTAEYTLFKANGWLLKDKYGAYLTAVDIPNEVLIDFGNAGYRNWLALWCKARIAEGYDGIFADNFPRPMVPSKYRIGTKIVINPRTGAQYTNDNWVNDELMTLAAVKVYAKVIGNGIPSAHDIVGYYANQVRADKIIASNIDGLMLEGPSGYTLTDIKSRSETIWQQNVDFIKLLNSKGKIVMFSNSGSSDMETQSTALYVYCTYLMNSPNAAYSFKFRGSTYMGSTYMKNLLSKSVGSSLSGELLMSGTGVRYKQYSLCTVYVNPTGSTYIVNGQSIGPHSGLIVWKS